MIKAYQFRMYPSGSQRTKINQTLGSVRFVYNYYLEQKQREYQETGKSKTCFDQIKDLKNLNIEKPFLKEVDSMSLRCALFDLEDAFKRMYKQKNGYPNYKSKDKKNTYRTNNVTSTYKGTKYENIKVDLAKKTITLPKLKEIKIRGYRTLEQLEGRIINATVSKENHKYYVSVTVEEENRYHREQTGKIIGLDLGVKNIITTSCHETIVNNKTLAKYERRIKKAQRALSRKEKGSNNYYKQKSKLIRIYEKIRNTRKYFLHQISKLLTEENDVIVTETLDIKKMTIKENNPKNLRKKILDLNLSELLRQIEYKSKNKGIIHIKIDKYYPSSQICSRCNNQNKELKNLSIREWECPECSNNNNRDCNAAENILFEGLRKYIEIAS